MERTELETKSKPQLIAMAAALGMALTPAATKGDMIDSLLGLPPGEPKAPKDEALPREGIMRTLDGEPMVSAGKIKVTIMATDTEKGDVFLRLNGHAIKIQRGVEVTIPVEFLGVLKDSIVNTEAKDPETGFAKAVQIMRHPFSAEPA